MAQPSGTKGLVDERVSHPANRRMMSAIQEGPPTMPSGSTVHECSVRLPFPAEAVFAWHARPGAIERLTPPWEHVQVIERSGGIEDGGRVVM